jgi:hypothetical protein
VKEDEGEAVLDRESSGRWGKDLEILGDPRCGTYFLKPLMKEQFSDVTDSVRNITKSVVWQVN